MDTIYLHTHILMKLIYSQVHAIFFVLILFMFYVCDLCIQQYTHTYIAYAGRHLFLVFFYFRFFLKNNDIFEFFHVVSCFSLGGWRIVVVVVAVMMVVGSRLNLLLSSIVIMMLLLMMMQIIVYYVYIFYNNIFYKYFLCKVEKENEVIVKKADSKK